MTFASKYPDVRYIVSNTTFNRSCFLPEDVHGKVLVQKGERVDNNTIIAQGETVAHHSIVEAAELLRLRKPQDLGALMLVEIGDTVEEGQVIAGSNPKRGRRAFAPVDGVVVGVDAGRVIIREKSEP